MANMINLINQRFGKLTVIKKSPIKRSEVYWECLCDCGNTKSIRSSSLRLGHTKSCGCISKEDLTNKKFGRLTVICLEYTNDKQRRIWKCKCDCGNENFIYLSTDVLNSGGTQSCGCYNKEQTTKANKKYNEYDLTGEYGIGITSNGYKFYFDLEDYDKIKDCCWYSSNERITTSKRINTKQNIYLMHQILLGFPKDCDIDHINRNPSDNRKSNLRIVTHSQNLFNAKLYKTNTSGCKGVSFSKEKNKWRANITINQKQIHLGYFANIEDAIDERVKAEEKYFGEYSYLNS